MKTKSTIKPSKRIAHREATRALRVLQTEEHGKRLHECISAVMSLADTAQSFRHELMWLSRTLGYDRTALLLHLRGEADVMRNLLRLAAATLSDSLEDRDSYSDAHREAKDLSDTIRKLLNEPATSRTLPKQSRLELG